MGRVHYSESDHQKAYELWLALGSCNQVSKQQGMPTTMTLTRWMKPGYECVHGCSWHSWEELKDGGIFSQEQMIISPGDMLQNVTHSESILQRRKEQLYLRLRGGVRQKIYPPLAVKYGCKEAVLDADWNCRDEWLFDAISLSEAKDIIAKQVGMFGVTQEIRWNAINNLLEMINIYRQQMSAAQSKPDAPPRVIPDEISEIRPAMLLLHTLIEGVDRTAARSIKATIALGAHVFGPPEIQPADPDIIVIDGEELTSVQFWARALEPLTDKERNALFESVERISECKKTPQDKGPTV